MSATVRSRCKYEGEGPFPRYLRYLEAHCPDCGWVGTARYAERNEIGVVRDDARGHSCEEC